MTELFFNPLFGAIKRDSLGQIFVLQCTRYSGTPLQYYWSENNNELTPIDYPMSVPFTEEHLNFFNEECRKIIIKDFI